MEKYASFKNTFLETSYRRVRFLSGTQIFLCPMFVSGRLIQLSYLLPSTKLTIFIHFRWRNTRYKNPQLVTQHCFLASFHRCFLFFTLRDQLNPQQKHFCVLKKVVAKSRAGVFEQQILALLLVFHQTHNLSRNKFVRTLTNQPINAPHFINPQQMFLLRVKLITQGENR